MLGFFRTYQRAFYAVITVVIVISFSFFGTYSTITKGHPHEKVLFHTLTGGSINRSQLEQMIHFISTDAQDKQALGGVWGPNFLNDGVIRRDFLESGLAEVLLRQHVSLIKEDFQNRLAKEKRWKPYKHPQAGFMTADMAWSYFAPDLKDSYAELLALEDGASDEAIAARVSLYLQEQKFPASALRQILMYQERQYDWIAPDPRLPQMDLALFQYHSLDDWFGSRFVHLVSQFVFNAAAVAEHKGYRVSKEEALVDLLRNNDRSFQQSSRSPHMTVANSDEYFKEQLRRLGQSEAQAVRVWQKVMLFRRLFEDVGQAAFVDPLIYEKFAEYAGEGAEVEVYSLPETLQIASFRSLQKLEVYLDEVSEPKKGSLLLPDQFLSGAEVAKRQSALVQKRYLIQKQEVSQRALQARVSLKDAWDWQLSDKGWEQLGKKFPDLALKKAANSEERLLVLDQLESRTREQVDRFSRAQLVLANPSWKEEALRDAKKERMELALRLSGGKSPLAGWSSSQDLIEVLDDAVAAGQAEVFLSPDPAHHYLIEILDGPSSLEILTFEEANREGILDDLLDARLQAHYEKIREGRAAEFKQADGKWKDLAEVRLNVSKDLFAGLLQVIRAEYPEQLPEGTETNQLNQIAAKRFYAQLKHLRGAGAEELEAAVRVRHEESEGELLSSRPPLSHQWKLERSIHTVLRSSDLDLEVEQAFELPERALSAIQTPDTGALAFYRVIRHLEVPILGGMGLLMDHGHEILGREAKLHCMQQMLDEIAEANAMDFSYLGKNVDPEA